MTAARLIQKLRENRLRVFTTRTAATLLGVSPSAASQLLNRLAREKLLLRLKRGIWANLLAPSLRIEEAVPYLTDPWISYVSLYSALSEHGLIAEVPRQVYGVTAGRPGCWDTSLGRVSLHHIPADQVWGFEMKRTGDGSFPLATPEKAYLDTLYLASVPRSPIQKPPFRHPPRFDPKRMREYLKKWDLRHLFP